MGGNEEFKHRRRSQSVVAGINIPGWLVFKIIVAYICASMKKLLIGSLLSLFVLFLDGYSKLYADQLPESFEQPCLSIGRESLVFVAHKFTSSEGERRFFKIEATELREKEEDEHEVGSYKKKLERSNYSVVIFCAQALGYFSSDSKQVRPFCKDLSYISLQRRHLVLQVFRI